MTDAHGDLVEELRLLMETVLERAEPALRRAHTGQAQDFAGLQAGHREQRRVGEGLGVLAAMVIPQRV